MRIDLPSGSHCHVLTRYSWDSAAGSPFRGSLRATLTVPAAAYAATRLFDVPAAAGGCWQRHVKKALGPLLTAAGMAPADRAAVWARVLGLRDAVPAAGTVGAGPVPASVL